MNSREGEGEGVAWMGWVGYMRSGKREGRKG